MTPKVSVIIPTYNRAGVLQRALNSVFKQSFKNFEVLVVDDGSSDETQKLLAEYLGGQKLRAFRTENNGVSAARNLGICKAQGEWIAFLDSDDEWLPEKLDLQLSWADNHPEVPLVHGEEIWIRNGVRVNPMAKHQKRGGDVFADAVRLCCISPSTVMLRRSLFDEVGLFREDFPVCEDFDLWLRITALHQVGYLNEFLIKKYGGHRDQLSRKFFAMDYWRILALKNIIESPHLSPVKKEVARRELQHKAGILLQGYRKHQNLENYQEVFRWVQGHSI